MLWILLTSLAFADPLDIQGPTWARFGSELAEAQKAGDHPGRITTDGGRACFTDKRHMLDVDWMIEVCAADGTHVDTVKVYTARDSEAAIVSAATRQNHLDAVSKRALETLVGQYGQPTDDAGSMQSWVDAEGEKLTLKQDVVTANRSGRYDAIVMLYERTPPDRPVQTDDAPKANTGL